MKKIFALVRHDLTPFSDCKIMQYYSSKRKSLIELNDIGKLFDAGVCFFDDSGYQTEICRFRGETFFYSIREIDVL